MAANDEIHVGRIVGAFGLRGELKCDPTSAGRTLFSAGAQLRCELRDGSVSNVGIAAARPHQGRLLVRLEGVEDAAAAAPYVGAAFYAAKDAIPLSEGEYLDADLVGCAVVGNDGSDYGAVEGVEHFPGSDVLVVGGRMVPMVAAIVVEIDLARRRIVVDPPGGLLD